MKRTRVLLPVAALLVAGLAVTGCSSSASSSSSSSSAPAPSSSAASPTVDPSVSAGPDAVLKWCKAYTEITTAMASAEPNSTGALTSLNALQSFDKLWAAGANLGYVTTEESDANRRAIVAYSQVMKLIAQGKKTDSQEVKDASKALTTVTTKDQALLASSSDKVQNLCAPFIATNPSNKPSLGVNPGSLPASTPPSTPASTPASTAPSPSKS